ncbi:MAG: hypothetical protein FWD71_03395 [Oscillospiraceae bacterium]|nr:hypothetical protein [Oscillospiraceae bacterium]
MEHKYIKEMFTRMNLQQIREFLLTGLDLIELDKRTYAQRLDKESQHIVKWLKDNSKDEEAFDEVYSEFSNAEGAYTEVFLEIGMKAGARLLFQLLCQDD